MYQSIDTVSLNVSEFLVPMDRYSVVNVREFLAVEPLLLTFKKKIVKNKKLLRAVVT